MTEQQFNEILQQNGESTLVPAIQEIAKIVVDVYTKGYKDGIELQQRVSNEDVDEWRQEAVKTALDDLINKLKGK